MPRILVIDDDPAIVELVSINLEMAGYDISQAGDGIRGQALAVQIVPDLIYAGFDAAKSRRLHGLSAATAGRSNGGYSCFDAECVGRNAEQGRRI